MYRERLAAIFRTRPRDEWVSLFAGTDGCVAPVLDLEEAPQHPHNQARGTFVEHEGVLQPAPAPRFSRTPSEISRRPPANGADTEPALLDWGFTKRNYKTCGSEGRLGNLESGTPKNFFAERSFAALRMTLQCGIR